MELESQIEQKIPENPIQQESETAQAPVNNAFVQMQKERMIPAIIAGAIAAVLGAIIWAFITVVTGYQIGWMAVGIGFAVGMAVRLGNGITPKFGYLGAGLSLMGCLLGNILSMCVLVSQQEQIPLMSILVRLDPIIMIQLLWYSFHPIDLLFYGLAIYEGYRFSFSYVVVQTPVEHKIYQGQERPAETSSNSWRGL